VDTWNFSFVMRAWTNGQGAFALKAYYKNDNNCIHFHFIFFLWGYLKSKLFQSNPARTLEDLYTVLLETLRGLPWTTFHFTYNIA